MDAEKHAFFANGVKKFSILKDMLREVAAGLADMEAALVQYDNDYASLDGRCKARQADLDNIEQKIRERNILAEAGAVGIREQLRAEKNRLSEMSEKLRIRENDVDAAQKKANQLLAAVEVQAESRNRPRYEPKKIGV